MNRFMVKACNTLGENGEIIWEKALMPRWMMTMFPVDYTGYFRDRWMDLVTFTKSGIDWDDMEFTLSGREFETSSRR